MAVEKEMWVLFILTQTKPSLSVCGTHYDRDGRLDLLIGDTPILDYYRANDPGCTLRTVDVIEEDNYAVGMTKGLRLQVSLTVSFSLSLSSLGVCVYLSVHHQSTFKFILVPWPKLEMKLNWANASLRRSLMRSILVESDLPPRPLSGWIYSASVLMSAYLTTDRSKRWQN